MFKTVLGIVAAGFILKRTSPKTYQQIVTAADDLVSATADITTALRGQAAAYTAEAAKDAAERLQQVDPQAISELRALLDGDAQTQQPAPRRPAPRRRP